MIYAVWIPLLMPFVAVPAARRLADTLSPVRAVRLLAATGIGLALCSLLALALLVVPGATRFSAVSAFGELVRPLSEAAPAVAVPLAAAALALLAGCAAAVALAARRHWLELQRAARQSEYTGGELAVLRDSRPDAYALPGRPGTPGRIVVTTGMLRALDPAERDALLAHERAHLVGRHHLFIAAAEAAALCHPALRSLRAPMGYAMERCADEAAASAVGDRKVAARAIGRAALAARAAEGAPHRPRVALAAAAGPVPRRVAALLGRSAPRPRVGRAAAVVLLACLVVSGAAALDATSDLHSSIEAAQGENARH
ncbi:M48 family metalloprotease [Streptomyces sp. NBC_01217]|uniref:M48 family metalloprotease n=1 Tax=Streptomyces sp. NBC_01217 TaxID=2903779 RepID=UPI002E0EAF8A|nr:M48 family metalloprotease [Streptomyces sp. NBC_01217]